jgi:hypothetical protein
MNHDVRGGLTILSHPEQVELVVEEVLRLDGVEFAG